MTGRSSVVSRVATILSVMTQGGRTLSLSEIAERSRLPAPTVHRMLEQLTRCGFVSRSPDRRYGVGPEFYAASLHALDRYGVVPVAQPLVNEIVATLGRVCIMSLYLPARQCRIVVAKADGEYPLAIRSKLHQCQDLSWGAAGRSILAYLPPSMIDGILSAAPEPRERTAIKDQLARIRASGVAVARGDVKPNVCAVSAPFLGPRHEVVGNLTLFEHPKRWNAVLEQRASMLVMQQAARLSYFLSRSA